MDRRRIDPRHAAAFRDRLAIPAGAGRADVPDRLRLLRILDAI